MRTGTAIRALLLACALLLGVNRAWAQDWPQWRGPNRDNKVTGFVEPKTWPKELMKKWRVTVGKGQSSPVLVGDKLYVFGRQGGDEVTLCLDAGSGKEIWAKKYAAKEVGKPAAGPKKQFAGTRSTPAVAEGKICTLGANGTVSCLDADTGNLVWRKEEPKPQFYTSTSPIIADGKCIVFAGSLFAFDLASGAETWKWSGAGAPYGSPVLMTVDDVKQVVTPASGALAGIALKDGKKLWQVDLGTTYFSNYSTPLIDGATVIYSESPAKGAGGAMMALKIEKQGDGFTAKSLWKKNAPAAGYSTPLLKDNLLFGLTPKQDFFCMDAKTGETLWTDKTKRGECGFILAAGSVLLALTNDAQLVVFEPSAKGFNQIASYRVADQDGENGPWSCPIIAGNRIYVKDNGGSLTLWTIE